MTEAGSLLEQAEEFAEEVGDVLTGALPGAPAAFAQVSGDRVIVEPEAPVELFVGGRSLATLKVRLRCQLDHRNEWLAIQDSSFGLWANLDRAPIIRFDYVRSQLGGHPSAHLQVHAHRGALSHLLSQAGHPQAHDMSRLHIPLGGARFRPCLEDVVEFLIHECRFDATDAWRDSVRVGRARWRRYQLRAVVRDLAEEAADVLRELGYVVTPPDDVPDESDRSLHDW